MFRDTFVKTVKFIFLYWFCVHDVTDKIMLQELQFDALWLAAMEI